MFALFSRSPGSHPQQFAAGVSLGSLAAPFHLTFQPQGQVSERQTRPAPRQHFSKTKTGKSCAFTSANLVRVASIAGF